MTLPTAAKPREISFDELRDTLNQKLQIIVSASELVESSYVAHNLDKLHARQARLTAMEAGKFLREVKVVGKP